MRHSFSLLLFSEVWWKSREWHRCLQQTETTNRYTLHPNYTNTLEQSHFNEDRALWLSRYFYQCRCRYCKISNLNHFNPPKSIDKFRLLLTNLERNDHSNVQICYDKQGNQEIKQAEPNKASWVTYYTFLLLKPIFPKWRWEKAAKSALSNHRCWFKCQNTFEKCLQDIPPAPGESSPSLVRYHLSLLFACTDHFRLPSTCRYGEWGNLW